MRGYARKVLKHTVLQTLQSGVVLLYHRVADLEAGSRSLAVSPRNFAEHLEVLRQSYLPVRLRELRGFARGLLPRTHPVALTFDDGYADNLRYALPLLEAAGIPATVFIVAGQIGSEEEYWWDDLERILLRTPDLPESLQLTIESRQFSWDLPRAGHGSDRQGREPSDQPCEPRQAARDDLRELLRPLSTPARERLLGSLRSWAKVNASGRAHNRALTEEEVVELAKCGLAEVGAHTMTHPLLSMQPIAVQKEEIEASKRTLERILNTRVRSFCYPFGDRGAYTSATVRLVEEAGYECACSGFFGRVYRWTDPHQIPRFFVEDWTGDEFARQLNAVFGA
jgi:peptidoglycan/xylan/chitin deacetylase (PgdA/CDA1 family)